MLTPDWLGAVPALAMAVDWATTARRWIRLRYFTKPLVLLTLLTVYGISGALPRGGFPAAWFAAGLFFSLLGDIFLMIPRNYFLAGLAAFLVAHLAYIVSFNPTSPPLSLPFLVLSLAVVAWAAFYYSRIRRGLAKTTGSRRLPLAALLYSLVITWMLLSALLTLFRPEWQGRAAVLVSAGGLLFFSSDSILAYDRFVCPLCNARLLVIVTYHLAQAALTLGMILHLTGY